MVWVCLLLLGIDFSRSICQRLVAVLALEPICVGVFSIETNHFRLATTWGVLNHVSETSVGRIDRGVIRVESVDRAEHSRPRKRRRAAEAAPEKIYELRIYTTNPGKLPDLHKRFREHTMQLFEKHGMENVIYWTLTEDFKDESKDNTLVYLLAHKSKAAAEASWKAFIADPEWQEVARRAKRTARFWQARRFRFS